MMSENAEKLQDNIDAALDVAWNYGQTDGAHHKIWVIDQIVRALMQDDYTNWVAGYEASGEYSWDTGIAP